MYGPNIAHVLHVMAMIRADLERADAAAKAAREARQAGAIDVEARWVEEAPALPAPEDKAP